MTKPTIASSMFPGATERATHPEGDVFDKYWMKLLLCHTGSCFERDVLRDCKEHLWEAWKRRAKEYDEQRGLT